MGVFQLPKIAHPDFYQLNKKPVGPVEIDWSNPIARRARVIMLPDAGGGNYDYVAGEHADIGGSINTSATHVGRAQFFDGTADFLSFPDHERFSPRELGIFCVATWGGTYDNNSDALIEKDYTSASEPYYVYRCIHSRKATQKQVQAQYNLSGTRYALDGSYAPTANRPFSYALSIKDGEQNLWAGDLGDISKQATNSHSGTVTNYSSEFRVGSSQLFSGHKHHGLIYLVLVVDGGFADSEVRSLDASPFQILKPATPLFYFGVAGSGGATNIDAACSFSFSNTLSNNKQATIEGSTVFSVDNDLGQGGIGDLLSGSEFNISNTLNTLGTSSILSSADYITELGSSTIAQTNANSNVLQNLLSTLQTNSNATLNADTVASISCEMQSVSGLLLQAIAAYGVVDVVQSVGDISVECSTLYNTDTTITPSSSVDAVSNVSYSIVQNTLAQAIGQAVANATIGTQSGIASACDMVISSLAACNIISACSSVSGIGIESDFSVSFINNLSSSSLSQIMVGADFQNILDVLSSNLSVLQAIAPAGMSQSISIGNVATLSGGIDVSITTTSTIEGIEISGSIITPDERIINIKVNSRNVSITITNREINIEN